MVFGPFSRVSLSRARIHLLITIFFAKIINSQPQPPAPEFTRTCADPLVASHLPILTHTYCFHACGFNSQLFTTCDTTSGHCVCRRPCSDDEDILEEPITFAPQICPPYPTDAPDPDPTALSNCTADCATHCSGGVGIICGEVAVLGPMRNVYAKICTCSCPAQRCTPLDTTTIVPLTVSNSTHNVQTLSVFPKNPLFKIKFLFLKVIMIIKSIVIVVFKKGNSLYGSLGNCRHGFCGYFKM